MPIIYTLSFKVVSLIVLCITFLVVLIYWFTTSRLQEFGYQKEIEQARSITTLVEEVRRGGRRDSQSGRTLPGGREGYQLDGQGLHDPG